MPAERRRISTLDAAREALDLVGSRLFPFRFERWLALGFVAMLDECGRGGGSGGFQVPGGGPGGTGGDGGGGTGASEVKDWISEHLLIILAIAACVLVLVVALTALVLWINSRGVFMYLDNVATGRYDVARPWREHATRAWSYFAWSFGVTMAGLLGVLLLLVPIGFLIFSLIEHGASCGPIGGIVAIVLLIIVFAIMLGLFGLLLRDFAAPLQVRLDVPCGQALRVAWGLVKGNLGAFVVYVILKIVFAIAAGIVSFVVGCFTCCIGFLPVIRQTILQPLFYFERAWSLFMLRHAGYDLFPAAPMAAAATGSPAGAVDEGLGASPPPGEAPPPGPG